MRFFLDDDGATMAAVQHVRLHGIMRLWRWFLPRPDIRAIGFVTELTDGSFLATGNSAGFGRWGWGDCPGILASRHAPNTPLEELLEAHRSAVRQRAALGVVPVRLAGKKEVIASLDRMHALRSAYRRKVGYLSQEDFERMFGGRLNRAQRQVLKEFEKARDQED